MGNAVGTALLFHIAENVFVGAGPFVRHDFVAVDGPSFGSDRTSFGGRAFVGAWWGGRPLDTSHATSPVPRFGERGTWVLSSDVGASFVASTYAKSSTVLSGFSLTPGIDYFVSRHLSFGGTATVSHGESARMDAYGAFASRIETAFAVGPRVGVDLPLTPELSFYPRGWVVAGVDVVSSATTLDTVSSASRVERTRTVVNVGLFAPLLVHVAPHAFVGAGPFAIHDVVGEIQQINATVRDTDVGGRVTLGGWL